MQKILITTLLMATLLGGCTIYRPDIQQGNLVTAEMRQKVTLGMDKATVQRLLGTPLIQDPFHSDRWDYYYSLQRQGQPLQRGLLTLTFEGNRLTRIEGDVAPQR